jgi:hypothetical protein
MRSYITSHPNDFGQQTQIASSTSNSAAATIGTAAPGSGTAQQTEAEKYAAQHKPRAETTTLDKIKSVFKAVFSVFRDLDKETLLGGLVVILLLSNIYTYYSNRGYGSTSQRRNRYVSGIDWDRQGGEADGGDDRAISRVVRLLDRGSTDDPVMEVGELMRVLDRVEERAERLRGVLKAVKVKLKSEESLGEID